VLKTGSTQVPINSLPSFKSAIENNEANIQLTSSLSIDELITIPSGRKIDLNNRSITLNMNGRFLVQGRSTIENGNFFIKNEGIIIQDSKLFNAPTLNNILILGETYLTKALLLDGTNNLEVVSAVFNQLLIKKVGTAIELKGSLLGNIRLNKFLNYGLSDFINGIVVDQYSNDNDFNNGIIELNTVLNNTLSIINGANGHNNHFNFEVKTVLSTGTGERTLVTLGKRDTLDSNLTTKYVASTFTGRDAPLVNNTTNSTQSSAGFPQTSSTAATGEESNALAFADKRYKVTTVGQTLSSTDLSNLFDTEDKNATSITFNGDFSLLIETNKINQGNLKLIGCIFDSVPDEIKFETSVDNILYTPILNLKSVPSICFNIDDTDLITNFKFIKITMKNNITKQVKIRKIFGSWLDNSSGAWLPITGGTVYGDIEIKGAISVNGNIIDGMKNNPVMSARFDDATGIMVVEF
jgi:hypothetical protein